MPEKTKTKSRTPRGPRRPAPRRRRARELGVMDQITQAVRRGNRAATLIGFVLGGFVPLAVFSVIHFEITLSRPLWEQPLAVMVLGGLVFSAKTVYVWTRQAFGCRYKALGFVALVEGCMTISTLPVVFWTALGILVAINGIGTGTRLNQSKAAP